MNASVTPTPPPLPLPRRAAPPVGLGRSRIEAAGQARGGAHKRSLTSQGARRIRSAPAATEPRRHRGAPESRIAQTKSEGFFPPNFY